MSTIEDEFRTDLQNDIFSELGKSVTLITKSGINYNSWGEEESATTTETTITIVPYNITNNRYSDQPMGELDEGDFEAAVPYDTSISAGDLITMDGITCEIKQLSKNYLPGNVCTIISLTKITPVVTDDVAST